MAQLNETHDPARRSWVTSANEAESDFPIQNLPFGVFHRAGESPRGGVAIGDRILDLPMALAAGLFAGEAATAARAASGPALNPLMALGPRPAAALRARLSDLLRQDGPERAALEAHADRLLVPMAEARFELPTMVANYTDFLCSFDHSRRMGEGRLPESFAYLPIAYHGRASSLRASGHPVLRPQGEHRAPDGAVRFGPEPWLDYELEFAAFIATGNALGSPVPIGAAPDHLFGYCLLNDWSARGIQFWESRPLGPFLGKSFLTTLSPWVVTAEALAPFRAPAARRAPGDPALLPHLFAAADQEAGGFDIALEALILTPRMRREGTAPARITATNLRHMYWTFAQMLTHHTSNGCNLLPGDVLASGTMSGPGEESRACLAELNARGTQPVHLPNGESRTWIEDGDEVVFRARAERAGRIAIGFGECRGRVEPARPWPSQA